MGQGYDGASVMSGKHSGVSARKQSLAKHAFYVHCNAHCLNVVIVDTVRAVPEASCFFFFAAAPLCVSVRILYPPEVAGHTALNVSGGSASRVAQTQ